MVNIVRVLRGDEEVQFRVDDGNNQLAIVFDLEDIVLDDGDTLTIEMTYEGGCHSIILLPHIREASNE